MQVARARLLTVLRRVAARVAACSSTWTTRESVAWQIALQSERTLVKSGARRYSRRRGGAAVSPLLKFPYELNALAAGAIREDLDLQSLMALTRWSW